MVNDLVKYIKKESREFMLMLAISTFLVLLFSFYYYFAGAPMTAARNSYNRAVVAYEAANYVSAKEFVEQSLEEWETEEAKILQKKIASELAEEID